MSEWISVKDRLPDKEGIYLCFYRYCGCDIFRILSFAFNLEEVDEFDFKGQNRSGWYNRDSEWGYYEMSEVTHWMPLPEPPKKSGAVSLVDGHIDE